MAGAFLAGAFLADAFLADAFLAGIAWLVVGRPLLLLAGWVVCFAAADLTLIADLVERLPLRAGALAGALATSLVGIFSEGLVVGRARLRVGVPDGTDAEVLAATADLKTSAAPVGRVGAVFMARRLSISLAVMCIALPDDLLCPSDRLARPRITWLADGFSWPAIFEAELTRDT